MSDPFAAYKDTARQSWAGFLPMEVFTMRAAPHLVSVADVQPGLRVLDVACGTGVVAITAAQRGAHVTGLDLTPTLLERARWNADTAGSSVTFVEGDAEALPFPDASFDVVLSQFGHIFAPRHEVAAAELLRVLRPGGTLALSTWPAHSLPGGMFAIHTRWNPSPPFAGSPEAWGDIHYVRGRFGAAIGDWHHEGGIMDLPALSVEHWRHTVESAGVLGSVAEQLGAERAALLREDLRTLGRRFFDGNRMRQEYVISRGTRVA